MKVVLRFMMFALGIMIAQEGFAQSKTITGSVTSSEDGSALPGVSVVVQGTSNGVSTDVDGNYSIQAEQGDVLVFSFIGMLSQEQTIGAGNTIDVALDTDTQTLEEVVVVGYGTQKRANLTGAVSTVDTEVLESRPITDVARGLQGTTPGLTITAPTGQIGENPSIRLRGNFGTLGTGGGAEPLILVNNVEVPNLNMINPQDIESVSVLKDAASTSIYGARAAWGVILITTKTGSRGTDPTVSYSNNFAWSTPTDMPEIAPAAEGTEMALAAARRINPGNASFGIIGMNFDELAIEKMREWEELYGGQDLGTEMVEGRDFEIRDGGVYWYRPWDAQEMFVREWTPQQKHDLSVSGGSESTNYYLGLGYLGQEGVLKVNPDEFNRYNVNLSINTTVTEWFDARANVLYSNSLTTSPFYFSSATYDPWYYVTRWQATYPYGTYEGNPFRSAINEVEQANMNEETNSLARLNLGATIRLLDDLSIDADFTHDRNDGHEHQVGGTLSALNFWNGYDDISDFQPVPYSSATYDRVQYNSSWSTRNTAKAFATYTKDLDNHAFKIIAGGDMEQYEYWFHSSQKRELMDPNLGEIDLATGDQFVDGARDKWATLGAFGRINYSFKDKFLLELNGRYDGSSRLSSSNKWAFFPSMSAGYVLTEESFMDFASPVLSFLKFRGSYGSIGNQNANLSNIYRIMSSYNSGWLMNGINLLTAGTPGALPASLTWETVTTLDFGVDSRFFDNRLGLNFDWYQRTVSDMHSAGVTLPSTFGTGSPTRNYGELQTTGWELAVDFRHSFDNGLNFNAAANLSDFTEQITRYANTTRQLPGPISGRNSTYYEGMILGEIWGYETDRFFTEDDFNADGSLSESIASQELYEEAWFEYGPGDIKYKDLNGDGVIDYGSQTVDDHGDMKVIGNSTPRYQYSFRLGADWKGFDLSVFMQGVGKREMWASGPVVIPGYRYNEAWYVHQLDYWTPENPDAFYPRPTPQLQSNNAKNFLPQTKYLLDMSYLRMKNITLGYTLPEGLTNRFGINRFRVYLSGENLFEFDNLDVPVDPEVNYSTAGLNDPNTFGRVYPFQRSLSLGIQVSL